MNIMTLNNIITDSDKDLIKNIIFGFGGAFTFYDEDGNTFESINDKCVIKDDDNVFHIVETSELEEKTGTFFFNGQPAAISYSHVVCKAKADNGDIVPTILELEEDVTLYPRGKVFEKFKSELICIPVVIENQFNQNDFVIDYLDSVCVDSESDDIENFVDDFVIFHPETHTRINYDKEYDSFYSCHLNLDYNSKMLDFALTFAFSWSIHECDYGK